MKKIKISISVVLLLAILFSFEKMYIIGALAFAICIHECGHIIAIYAFGGKIGQCSFNLSGMNINYSGGISYVGECIIAAAGGFFNMMAFACCAYFAIKYQTDVLVFFCAINIILCLFNMLPALPLDGGIFMRAMLSEIFNFDKAEKITNALTFVIGIIMLLFGALICFATHGNITMMVASAIILRQPFLRYRECNS